MTKNKNLFFVLNLFVLKIISRLDFFLKPHMARHAVNLNANMIAGKLTFIRLPLFIRKASP